MSCTLYIRPLPSLSDFFPGHLPVIIFDSRFFLFLCAHSAQCTHPFPAGFSVRCLRLSECTMFSLALLHAQDSASAPFRQVNAVRQFQRLPVPAGHSRNKPTCFHRTHIRLFLTIHLKFRLKKEKRAACFNWTYVSIKQTTR